MTSSFDKHLNITVGTNDMGRVCLEFSIGVQLLELEPAMAIEIANALIGNAFQIIQNRTPESKKDDLSVMETRGDA